MRQVSRPLIEAAFAPRGRVVAATPSDGGRRRRCRLQQRSESRKEVARPVKVAVVGDAERGRTLTYSGVVRPRIESAVGFRVPGKIIERLVNVGDNVEIDQIIARLDDIDLGLAEHSAKAAVNSARSRRDVARDNLQRGKVLLPTATISQAAYDTRRNEMDAAASALESAQAQLRQATNAVGYATLRAHKARHRDSGPRRSRDRSSPPVSRSSRSPTAARPR